ncbi:hypothetical protein GBA52_015612 [Prunus armeniaca]|nr:hypothetical protein GBA52_015612 [Prunus armeniaca]
MACFQLGFFQVGENAYSFAIWFTEPSPTHNLTVVWMSNRDQPVNGRGSKLILQNNGNLILTDAGKSTIWSSNTVSNSFTKLLLHDNGNLVLLTLQGLALWESFALLTNTLLPQQPLTRNTKLISSRSLTNYSSGFYSFSFDNENTLRLLYNSPELSSIYWPDPWRASREVGRSTYNNSRIAMFDHLGSLSASDNFSISSADYGAKLQRILKMDADGNVRLYSRAQQGGTWVVSWQAISEQCRIHGIYGANSLCSHVPSLGRKCSCLPGYEMRNKIDWSYGCQPQPAGDHFNLSWSCNNSTAAPDAFGFMHLPHVEFYGYDFGFYSNYTLERCRVLCLELCNCAGFQYKYDPRKNCFLKAQLENGRRTRLVLMETST